MSSILKVSEIQDPTNGNTALKVASDGAVQMTTVEHTNGTSALEIDSSGFVGMKSIPAFQTDLTATTTTNGGTFTTKNTPQVNNGSHWNTSTHRFTAPRGGRYVIMWTGYTNYTTSYGYFNIYKNGSNFEDWHFNHNANQIHTLGSGSLLIDLNENDYIDFRRGGGGSGTWTDMRVGGYLLFY